METPPEGRRALPGAPRGSDMPEPFGQYLLYESLGRGAMASVRRGVLCGVAGFRRVVALKQLHPHLAKLPEMVEAFAREARLGSYLRHSNLVQAFDFGTVDGTYFMATELVRGPTLSRLAQQRATTAGPIPIGIVLGILIQLCDAFDYLHRACDPTGRPLQLVHGDASPTHVIVSTTGCVKLIDLGISRRTRLAYAAPEHATGKLDVRSDLFSLGAIAHELLARSGPVPSALQDVVLTALQRDPDRRWQTAAELRSALSDVARDMAMVIGPPQIARWIGRAMGPTPAAAVEAAPEPVADDPTASVAAPVEPPPASTDLGLVPVAGPHHRTLVVVHASACDPTVRIHDVRPPAETARAESESGVPPDVPPIEATRAESEPGSSFQDAPTTLHDRRPRSSGPPVVHRARGRLPRPSTVTRVLPRMSSRELTRRFPWPAARRRQRTGTVVGHPRQRRMLAHTLPRGLRNVERLRGTLAAGTPRSNPAVELPAEVAIARTPVVAALRGPSPRVASPEPAIGRPSGSQAAVAAPAAAPAPIAAAPRSLLDTTGVVIVPASRHPDRAASAHGARADRERLPRARRLAAFALLAAVVAFALAYLWLRR